ncbi:hypothetical protein GCM10023340_15910 [Nocardioides marinquilinus]|uniref:CdiI immunity protein domain-containing protein n=1 Tax=Nocardioides marinquilinus TaxID=1210400 RepID=A0ABP9PFS2_9ACTN
MHTLLCAYHHEDWDLDGPGIYDALAAYLRDVSGDEARQVARQIDQLLLDTPDDQALGDYLDHWSPRRL